MRWVVALFVVLSSLGNVAFSQEPAPLAALDSMVMLFDSHNNYGAHGTMIGPNQIATAAHVAKRTSLRWQDMHGRTGAIKSAVIAKNADAAVLTTEDPAPFDKPVAMSAGPVSPGERLWFRLYIGDGPQTAWTSGTVLGVDKEGFIRVDGMVWPGSSGGGAVDRNNRLRGIVRSVQRPGNCFYFGQNFNNLVGCILTTTLARSSVDLVPVEALPK